MTGEDKALPSFCVVVPMYNERSHAGECVRRISEMLATVQLPTALAIINDGSGDGTTEILGQLQREFEALVVINHETNRGYGAALRTGMQFAIKSGFDYALFMDSDMTNHPDDIPKFVAKMEEGYDVIKATRYSDGGNVSGVPTHRVLISKVGNSIARLLYRLPIADCTNGFRAIRTTLLSRMVLTESKFPIIMQELYYSRFLTSSFAEVPVTLTNRGDAQRRTSFVYRPRVFYDYLKYPLKAFFGINPNIPVLREGTK